MKILQLNMWGGRLGKQIFSDFLARENADVLCLQEAIELPGGKCLLTSVLDEIVDQSKYPYTAFIPQLGFKAMNRKARLGLAIASKLPLLETNEKLTGTIPFVDDFDFVGVDLDYNVRHLQHASIDYEGKKLHVLNHHGHHVPEHKNGDEETMRQCGIIVDYIKNLKGPIVLCGDFNLAPDSESLEQINSILINHAKERGVITTRTPLTHKTEVCDYIFTSPDIEVSDFQVLDDIVSDHKALTVEF